MKTTVITEKEFAVSKNIWDELLSKSSNNEFFLTWEWIYTWWQIYGKGKKLLIIFINNDQGSLVGIAPWYIKKTSIQFIGSGENVAPEYLNIIIKNGAEEIVVRELVQFLLSKRKTWSMVRLNDITEKHPIINELLAETKKQKFPAYKYTTGTPCVYLPLPNNNNDLWAKVSSKFRYNIKWGRNKVTEMPKNRIKLFLNEPIPFAVLETIFNLHNKRMAEKGGIGKFNHVDYRQFHSNLINAIPHHTAVALLETDEKPVAMIYGYHYDKKIYFYQSGFDPESNLKRFSPVQILLSVMIEKAIDLKCSEFDFLRGEEEYKHRWSNCSRKKEAVVIYNNLNLLGRILKLKFEIKCYIKGILHK